MSKFITKIPTEVESLTSKLPKQSFVHSITLCPQTNQVVILWENAEFETGLTVPIECSVEHLEQNTIKCLSKDFKKKIEPVVEAIIPSDIKPFNAPLYMSREDVEAAVKDGKPVEFQGVLPNWQDFTEADTFIEGYFYRLKHVKEIIVTPPLPNPSDSLEQPKEIEPVFANDSDKSESLLESMS